MKDEFERQLFQESDARDASEWTEESVEAAIERQRQRFVAYMESGLSLTKWILEREMEE